MENGCRFLELIDKALYFARLNRFVESREILQVIPAIAYNHHYFLAQAICCIGQENYQTAINYLEFISSTSDYKTLKLLIKCYEKLNDIESIAKVYLRMRPKDIKQSQWLKMFDCFQTLGDEEKIQEIYRTVLQKFPSNLEIRYKYAEHLFEKNHPGFLMMVDECIKKNPFHIRFHLLKIKYALKHKRLIYLDHYLQYVLHEFPFIMETHYLLMQYYLLMQMPQFVKLYQRACINRMNDFINLSLEFEEFNSKFSELNQLSILQPPKQVVIPSIIRQGFETCQHREACCYLVGSVVHNLIDGRILAYSQDLDFVSNVVPERNGFLANPHMANLYTNSIFDEQGVRKKVDYFVVPYANDVFLQEDFLTRDFTINALYVDSLGNISDPSGLGFHDYCHKTLRSVDAPKKSFAQDPSRILRAIKLIAQGFQPVDELKFALANWMPNEKINYHHIYFLTRKIMHVINPLDFVFYLKQYQLLSKLFIISDNQSDERALYAINQRIYPQTDLFFNATKHLQGVIRSPVFH